MQPKKALNIRFAALGNVVLLRASQDIAYILLYFKKLQWKK